ncbi:HAAS signaling domain-containing protein [Dietzia sp. NPDC055343]
MTALTDRYITEVVRRLPENQRDDIATEIAAVIEDMAAAELDSAVAPGADPDAAERAALARLGDPAVLARRYSGQRQYLIGPGTYPVWVRVLRWLLPVVGVIAALANGIVYVATTPEPELGGLIGQVVGGVVPALLGVFAAWTIIVAIVERSTPDGTPGPFAPSPDWDPATLEAAPPRAETRVDAIVSLIVLAVLAAVPFIPSTFLYIGHLNNGEPLINPGLPTAWLAGYLILLVALALMQVWLLVQPGARRGRLVIEVAVDVAFGVFLTGLVLIQGQVIHPDLVATDADGTTTAIRWVVIIAIWAIVVWDQVETLRAYRREAR